MTEDNLIVFFFNEKKARAIVCIRRNQKSGLCVSDVSRKVDTTYAHTCKIVKAMNEAGLVEKKKVGRKKHLTLTKKGEEISDKINQVFNLIDSEQSVMTSDDEGSEAPDYLTQGGIVKG